MSHLLRLKGRVSNPMNVAWQMTGALALALASLLAGCQSSSERRPVDLDEEIARASDLRQPVIILVTESGASQADDQAGALFESLTGRIKKQNMTPVLLDLAISRNRAEAAQFHVTETPMLLTLSPEGLIVTRDQTAITKELLRQRMQDVPMLAHDLDAKRDLLVKATTTNANVVAAEMELADFLLAGQNQRASIPIFGFVARSELAGTSQRVRAWVELARAYLWIGEAEKGRHEAEELIAVLGPKTPEARAGGNLIMGMQDASQKRPPLARQEFEAAIAAAPESDYAKQAAGALEKLPGEGK